MNYLHTVNNWFNPLRTKQKIALVCSLGLFLFFTSMLCWWLFTPAYKVLFSNLDQPDAKKVLTLLEQEQINYRVGHDNSILIDKELIPATRLKIMGSGLELSGTVGFELFDKNDLGMTDFSQQINYLRALQGELERTISSFNEVHKARVHLVLPEKQWFNQESNQPKAAVTLYLKQAISLEQIHSIQRLIAASVANLNLKNVVIVDQNGRALTSATDDRANSHFLNKKMMEKYLNTQVTQVLSKIFLKSQIIVKVNVDINFDELQRQLIKPQAQAHITHEKQMKHHGLSKKEKSVNREDITFEKTYEYGKEQEQFKRAIGTLERLSVSVVLPKNTDAKTIIQVQNLIKNTVGFNSKRGDSISVEALINSPITPFLNKKPLLLPSQPTPTELKFHFMTFMNYKWLLAIGCLIFVVGSTTYVYIKNRQKNQRHQLLNELTQWLNHYE